MFFSRGRVMVAGGWWARRRAVRRARARPLARKASCRGEIGRGIGKGSWWAESGGGLSVDRLPPLTLVLGRLLFYYILLVGGEVGGGGEGRSACWWGGAQYVTTVLETGVKPVVELKHNEEETQCWDGRAWQAGRAGWLAPPHSRYPPHQVPPPHSPPSLLPRSLSLQSPPLFNRRWRTKGVSGSFYLTLKP